MNGLNPELRRGFTPPYGQDYALRVPKEKAKSVTRWVLKGAMKAPRVFQPYRVRFGERLRDIALRHGISRTVLAAYNDLNGEPEAGAEIIVPKVSGRRTRTQPLTVLQDPGLEFNYPDRKPVYFAVRYPMSVASVAHNCRPAKSVYGMVSTPLPPLHKGMALRLYLPKDFPTHTANRRPRSHRRNGSISAAVRRSPLRSSSIIEHGQARQKRLVSKRYQSSAWISQRR